MDNVTVKWTMLWQLMIIAVPNKIYSQNIISASLLTDNKKYFSDFFSEIYSFQRRETSFMREKWFILNQITPKRPEIWSLRINFHKIYIFI